ncbi:nucleotide exchange factor GrpE [Listeria ivanovii]|uniref:Protein GrpE n=2 Tax=Listeria ivanovii TaxID=1638 RepID=A0ABS1G6S8_LISIV|nr:nucleotide exchange factor GrpE [Listeria ivanovii]AIS59878.1 heat shock protein GrpE [Listeria ivanovii subsp. londoniensis]AIS62706.1 heat shock protein GrpE [Listeria ivanovii subsp. londoniensis]MBC2254269.1 nucleotide exchange factor GrpE [Listeria ivanovii]MBK1962589.1 nucleotide exchange factor GrpE [Listeria ivanovii subsp. londoniensis]MBK1967289.1 nucleotide exchange factor GrpE [Listeria ivanovii subsp. londoniensis]
MSEKKNKKEKLADEIEQEELNILDESDETTEENIAENTLTEDQAKILELENKLDEMENRYLRTQADFDNVKKRHIAELDAKQKYRSQSLAQDLLPALDSFEKALATKAEQEEVKQILKGMEMVYNQILVAFEKEGIEVIPAIGEQFDPNFHQAVMQDSNEDIASNEITAELQKGYKLKDRVIRPSMVKVNQ